MLCFYYSQNWAVGRAGVIHKGEFMIFEEKFLGKSQEVARTQDTVVGRISRDVGIYSKRTYIFGWL